MAPGASRCRSPYLPRRLNPAHRGRDSALQLNHPAHDFAADVDHGRDGKDGDVRSCNDVVRVILYPERGRDRRSGARVALVVLSGVYTARLSRASCRQAGRGLLTRLASVRLCRIGISGSSAILGPAPPDRFSDLARVPRALRCSVGARRPVGRRGTIRTSHRRLIRATRHREATS